MRPNASLLQEPHLHCTREKSLGKPLISDDAMKGMYHCMQRLLAEQSAKGFATDLPANARNVLQGHAVAPLAALFSQLHRRDTVLTEGANPLAQTATDAWFAPSVAPVLHALPGTAEACATVAAGMALRIADRAQRLHEVSVQRQARPRPVTVALLLSFPPLQAVLHLIQQHDLAVILLVRCPAESRATSDTRMQGTGVPILLVDEADAVALCRVTQECLLRARNGWGGSVIHAAPLPGAGDPLSMLAQHLQTRGVELE